MFTGKEISVRNDPQVTHSKGRITQKLYRVHIKNRKTFLKNFQKWEHYCNNHRVKYDFVEISETYKYLCMNFNFDLIKYENENNMKILISLRRKISSCNKTKRTIWCCQGFYISAWWCFATHTWTKKWASAAVNSCIKPILK